MQASWFLLASVLFVVLAVSGISQVSADPVASRAANAQTEIDFRYLDREIQALKQAVIELNRDLRLLEQEVRYPAGQQLVVFLSLQHKAVARLEAVTVALGGRLLAEHVYSAQETAALRDGGVHRLYEGRLEAGNHYLDINLAGVTAGGEPFTAATLVKITKHSAPKFIELQLHGGGEGQQTDIVVQTW
jgi:hypothetical protein